MKTSNQGLALIKEHEGLRLHLYNDTAGHCTIGYGHLVHLGQCNGKDSRELPFSKGIDQATADAVYAQDVAEKAESHINKLVSVPLTQNQYDALASFVFNVGEENFRGSTLLRKLNARDYAGCANEFPRWNKAGGVVSAGLVERRAEEKALFEGVA